MNTNVLDTMIGKHVRLTGMLVDTGKGNYILKTTNGVVTLDGFVEATELRSGETVTADGTLEMKKAFRVSENEDPLWLQSRDRPGDVVPARYVLRQPKIVRP